MRKTLSWGTLAPALVLGAALLLRWTAPDLVEGGRNRVFDAFQRLKPRPYQTTPVRIVDIDDESLAKIGQWPWPRKTVARLVARLAEAGAAVAAFDIVFAEPDRTSPARAIADWPALPELKALAPELARLDHDAVLERSFRAMPVVAGFVLTAEPNDGRPEVKAGFSYGGEDPAAFLRADLPGAVTNLRALERAAAGNGSFNMLPDQDGVVRRVPMFFRLRGAMVPSLAAEALRVYEREKGYKIRTAGASGELDVSGRRGISAVGIGDRSVPTDRHGQVWVHYTTEAPVRTVPAWRVLSGDLLRTEMRGAIAFIGTSASGLKDLRVTPLDPVAPGVEVHAQLAEQVLLGRFLERPDWALGVENLWMLALGAAFIALIPRLGALWCAAGGAMMVAVSFAASWRAYSAWGWLLDPVFPAVTAGAVYIFASAAGYLDSERKRREVRAAFNRYMSPDLVEELAEHPELLKLGGERRNMSFLFADIRGFTALSEHLAPEELTSVINRFMTPMTEVIMKYRGTIDKYMGDCVMAFWNAPLDDAQHPADACRAALAMRERLARLNEEWSRQAMAQGKPLRPLEIGIGINSGDCCVGNMGSEQRFDYSVLGDEVNLAARLQDQSKTYGVEIIVGANTFEKAPDFAFLELDLLRVRGKTKPVRVFTLLGAEGVKRAPSFQELQEEHAKFLEAYRAMEFEAALEQCRFCRDLGAGPATLYDLYAKRIQHYLEAPPPKDWDGVFEAAAK